MPVPGLSARECVSSGTAGPVGALVAVSACGPWKSGRQGQASQSNWELGNPVLLGSRCASTHGVSLPLKLAATPGRAVGDGDL